MPPRSSSSQPATKEKRKPAIPRPSASIVLLSPTNQVLLLHRVQTSSSFASAHVFPGGNLSAFHEPDIPKTGSAEEHRDGPAYRAAAIRETFEESGILLATAAGSSGTRLLLELPDDVRESGRKEVHADKVTFRNWLGGVGGDLDVDGLIPFTRWVTPPNMPKRFTTQMYLYMLPLSASPADASSAGAPADQAIIPTPTADGGLEHVAATFDDVSSWLKQSRDGEIILFPPQLFLLALLSSFLTGSPVTDPSGASDSIADTLATDPVSHYRAQREALLEFLGHVPTTKESTSLEALNQRARYISNIPWAEKVISPTTLFLRRADKRSVLGLDKPGPELEGADRGGDWDRVVLVHFRKEGPRDVEVRWRDEVVLEEREAEKAETEHGSRSSGSKL